MKFWKYMDKHFKIVLFCFTQLITAILFLVFKVNVDQFDNQFTYFWASIFTPALMTVSIFMLMGWMASKHFEMVNNFEEERTKIKEKQYTKAKLIVAEYEKQNNKEKDN